MSVLEPDLAQKFIDKTAKNLDYNINIMNEKGMIIASKDPSRVGDFHEVAYGLLNGTLETGVVNEERKYIGTKPGINMFIDYNNKHVGVICVTGNPDNVHAFAGLVKTSMEAMLEYEVQMKNKRRKTSKVEQFLYYLLFEENIDMSIAHNLADSFELNKDVLRVAIIIKCSNDHKPQDIVKLLMKVKGHSFLDLITVARNDDIILFRSVKSKGLSPIADYKFIIEEYIENFIETVSENYKKEDFTFFVGTLQKQIEKYRNSYIHAQEMSLHVKGENQIYYFDDHIVDYFRSLVTLKVYDNIFSIYEELFSEDEKQLLVETVEVLSRNNYNVVNSAKELYIHRNTMIFRLNKIKNALNIDPIANASDREFLNELAYYFSNK